MLLATWYPMYKIYYLCSFVCWLISVQREATAQGTSKLSGTMKCILIGNCPPCIETFCLNVLEYIWWNILRLTSLLIIWWTRKCAWHQTSSFCLSSDKLYFAAHFAIYNYYYTYISRSCLAQWGFWSLFTLHCGRHNKGKSSYNIIISNSSAALLPFAIE